jgi:ankyrin repeat protein
LLIAVELGDLDFFKELVGVGADIFWKDLSGNNILHIATAMKKVEMVDYIIHALHFPARIINNFKETPYQLALTMQTSEIKDIDFQDILEMLQTASRGVR